MKFKTKEELLNKVTDDGYIGGIEDAFKSFAERVEFYKKYRDNYKLLIKDVKSGKAPQDCTIDFLSYIGKKKWYDKDYNNWLFDYCFGDVVE